jgi:transposase-like protein
MCISPPVHIWKRLPGHSTFIPNFISMTMQQEQAYTLYLSGSATQKQIAEATGVSEKTIYNWSRQFRWHQQRQQHNDVCRSVSENLCRQLLVFQQQINDREDVPTAQELNTQVRLVNSILKLEKTIGKTQQADAMTEFLEFVANTNEQAGNLLLDMYIAYADAMEAKKQVRKQPVKTSNQPVTHQQPEKQEPAPITQQDFNDYRHLLNSFGDLTDRHTTRFRGRFVNSRWLQYNLLQYCLPPDQRRFMGDARKVLVDTDATDVQLQVAAQLSSLRTAA